MRLHVDPSSPEPIWCQIEAGVRRLVISRALAPGAPLPSVRDLARELRVNPATVARAYQRLTESGLVEVRRGDGTYVADRPPARRAGAHRRELREAAARYAAIALSLGADVDEAAEALTAEWARLAPAEVVR
jgi:GntR family transcriptional regulator